MRVGEVPRGRRPGCGRQAPVGRKASGRLECPLGSPSVNRGDEQDQAGEFHRGRWWASAARFIGSDPAGKTWFADVRRKGPLQARATDRPHAVWRVLKRSGPLSAKNEGTGWFSPGPFFFWSAGRFQRSARRADIKSAPDPDRLPLGYRTFTDRATSPFSSRTQRRVTWSPAFTSFRPVAFPSNFV